MSNLKEFKSWLSAYKKANDCFPEEKLINAKIEGLLKESDKVYSKQPDSNKIDFEKLIAYFNKVLLKNTRVISKKAKDNLNQRIKEGYEKSDIVKVIDNVSHDSFHKESNFKHVTLEFLSRPNIFERYSSMEHKKPETEKKQTGHVNY